MVVNAANAKNAEVIEKKKKNKNTSAVLPLYSCSFFIRCVMCFLMHKVTHEF